MDRDRAVVPSRPAPLGQHCPVEPSTRPAQRATSSRCSASTPVCGTRGRNRRAFLLGCLEALDASTDGYLVVSFSRPPSSEQLATPNG